MEKPLIGLDARRGRQISVGMRTYMEEVSACLPRVASEFAYRAYTEGEQLAPLEQLTIPLRMRRDGVDIAHFMSQYVPLFAGGRFIVTIHDMIHLRFPDLHKRSVPPYYEFVIKPACRRAARVLTDDERTVPDLVHFLNVDPAKIRVIPLAPRERFFTPPPPHAAQRPYLINVGNHREHKDIRTLLAAWSSLPPGCELDLYLTGPDDLGGELQRRSTAHRRAMALGDVDDEELASYYAGALALVHPALLEGFGLPLAEAMAAGTAVVGTTTSIPQPLAAASLLFEPGDVEALRAWILRLYDDEAFRRELIERGRNAARKLSWERTARETADVYREVLEEHR